MAELSIEADKQIQALERHYISKAPPKAIDRLRETVIAALVAADAPDSRSRRYPSTYRAMASVTLRWLKIHRYWFAYVVLPASSVVTMVIYETANIPKRVRPRD